MAERTPLIQILKAPPAPAASEPRASTTVEWTAVVERMRALAGRPAIARPAEVCEFCGAEIDEPHGHLVDLPNHALVCVCRPCYLLFTHDGAGGARFRAVPDRYAVVPELAAAPDLWDRLQIPIGLAFFFTSGSTGRTTAFYPSPAGATESELPLETWQALAERVPPVRDMAHDVEALLVRRTASIDALFVPIDACYELVGRIRRSWRGFQGGDEVWREIDEFFARALERAGSRVK